MVEHYFVNARLPKAGSKREYYMTKGRRRSLSRRPENAGRRYRAGATGRSACPLHAGPQEQDRLKAAATGLDLVVDYGMFSLHRAPMFWLLRWFHSMVANWGWAIVIHHHPDQGRVLPAQRRCGPQHGQDEAGRPQDEELQTRYADDRVKLNQAMMELYKKEKINPLGGCRRS